MLFETPSRHEDPQACTPLSFDDEQPFVHTAATTTMSSTATPSRRPLVSRPATGAVVPPLASPRAPMTSLPRNAPPTVAGLLAKHHNPVLSPSEATPTGESSKATPSNMRLRLSRPSLTTPLAADAPLSLQQHSAMSGPSPRLRTSSSALLSARSGRGTSVSSLATSRRTSPSQARATTALGARGQPSVIDQLRKKLPSTAYSTFSFDVAKYLREVAQRRQETVVLRVLPKSQQVTQLVESEQMQREVLHVEEANYRINIQNKKAEEYSRKRMAQLSAANKARQEALKKQQSEELTSQKTLVAEALKTTEVEIRDRLPLVNQLQPRNAAVTAALADVKKEDSDLSLLGELLEEEKRLQKGLKADARFNAPKTTAPAGGGAFSFWLKQCVASSFNVDAILKGSSLRAAVMDVAATPTKLPAEKRLLVVRDREDDPQKLWLWAQGRCCLEELPAESAQSLMDRVADAKLFPGSVAGRVLWTKDDFAELTKQSKQSEAAAAVLLVSSHTLTFQGISSIPLLNKDIMAMGEQACDS